MNISTLEKMARRILSGESISETSDSMVKSGILTPAEHRSLRSLSSQIAANIQVTTGIKPQLVLSAGPGPITDRPWI